MNDKLRRVALMDNLTGLYNRQGLQNNLDKEFEETDKITAVFYIDLDNFKYYNDTFGHEIGDLVLVSFANIIKNICKEKGVAVIFVGEDLDVLISLCDRIVVIGSGCVTGIVDARTTTKEEIGLLMTKSNRGKENGNEN